MINMLMQSAVRKGGFFHKIFFKSPVALNYHDSTGLIL